LNFNIEERVHGNPGKGFKLGHGQHQDFKPKFDYSHHDYNPYQHPGYQQR
jgi:hypothetical protein